MVVCEKTIEVAQERVLTWFSAVRTPRWMERNELNISKIKPVNYVAIVRATKTKVDRKDQQDVSHLGSENKRI
jgi:hypothetical protein